MNRLLIEHRASDGRSAVDDVSISLNWPYRDRSKVRRESSHIAVYAPKNSIVGFTNTRGALNDSVEHRLYVCRRAANDAEHFGRCRLMLQRFAKFHIAPLDLL